MIYNKPTWKFVDRGRKKRSWVRLGKGSGEESEEWWGASFQRGPFAHAY